jgi:hypothetical protein
MPVRHWLILTRPWPINDVLNEALRVHGGPSRRIFQVRVFLPDLRLAPLSLLHPRVSDFASSRVSSAGDMSWRAGLGSGTTTSLS